MKLKNKTLVVKVLANKSYMNFGRKNLDELKSIEIQFNYHIFNTTIVFKMVVLA